MMMSSAVSWVMSAFSAGHISIDTPMVAHEIDEQISNHLRRFGCIVFYT